MGKNINRRKFLGNSATAVAALQLFPVMYWGVKDFWQPMIALISVT